MNERIIKVVKYGTTKKVGKHITYTKESKKKKVRNSSRIYHLVRN